MTLQHEKPCQQAAKSDMLRAEAGVLCRVPGLVRVSRQAWGGVGEAVSRKGGCTAAKSVSLSLGSRVGSAGSLAWKSADPLLRYERLVRAR